MPHTLAPTHSVLPTVWDSITVSLLRVGRVVELIHPAEEVLIIHLGGPVCVNDQEWVILTYERLGHYRI